MTDQIKNARAPEPKVADTIESAAGQTDYTVSFLQALKGRGCPAFRGGRVYLDELDAYYAENITAMEEIERECDDLDGVDAELKRQRLRKVTLENDAAAGLVIRKTEVAAKTEELALELKNTLRRSLEDDAPRDLVGKTEEEIRAALRDVVDDICAQIHRGTEWMR